MRFMVATVKGGLDDFVNHHFGRTPTFTVVDIENKDIIDVQIVQNPGYNAPKGAGVQAAQFCINQGASVVIAGVFGPNSYQILQAARIRFVSAPVNMRVEQAIRAYLEGKLTRATLGRGKE